MTKFSLIHTQCQSIRVNERTTEEKKNKTFSSFLINESPLSFIVFDQYDRRGS